MPNLQIRHRRIDLPFIGEAQLHGLSRDSTRSGVVSGYYHFRYLQAIFSKAECVNVHSIVEDALATDL